MAISNAQSELLVQALSMAANVAGQKLNAEANRQQMQLAMLRLEQERAMFDSKADLLRHLIGALIENAKAKADMLLANFATKIFHNNADPETNRWAADTIGKSIQYRGNVSEGHSTGRSAGMNSGGGSNWGSSSGFSHSNDSRGGSTASSTYSTNAGGSQNWGRNIGVTSGFNQSHGVTEVMDYEIEAGDFSRHLLTGGPRNNNRVTGVWFQAGKRFDASGRNYLFTSFAQ